MLHKTKPRDRKVPGLSCKKGKKNYSSSRRVTFLNLKSNTMKNTMQNYTFYVI